jgi:hypothetical protein
VVAVFGSAAQVAPAVHSRRSSSASRFSPGTAAVFERVLALIKTYAPEIAGPIVDRGVAVGAISRAERQALIADIAHDASGLAALRPRSAAAAQLRVDALAAIARAAPRIARPVLDDAVASERLTSAQQRRILERLEAGQALPLSFSR